MTYPTDPRDPLYPLRSPARYPLSVLLHELRWARPANEQRWLAELSAVARETCDPYWADSVFGNEEKRNEFFDAAGEEER